MIEKGWKKAPFLWTAPRSRGYAFERHSFDTNEAQASRLIQPPYGPSFSPKGHVRLFRLVFLLSVFALLAGLLPAARWSRCAFPRTPRRST